MVVLAAPGFSVHLDEWFKPGELDAVFSASIPVWIANHSTVDLLEDAGLWRLAGGKVGGVLPTSWWDQDAAPTRPWCWICQLSSLPSITPTVRRILADAILGQKDFLNTGMGILDFESRILGQPTGRDTFIFGPFILHRNGNLSGENGRTVAKLPEDLVREFIASDNMIERYSIAHAIFMHSV